MTHDSGDRRGKPPLERADASTQRPLLVLTIDEFVQVVRAVMREELARAHGPQTTAQPQLESPSQYLTVQEVARLCGVAERTIRTWTRQGMLPARRMGRLLRIDRRDLEDYLASSDGAPSSNRLDADALASNILSRRWGK
jgi:excisionase family DNA binding protein